MQIVASWYEEEGEGNEREKMSYFCKLSMAFGRLATISHICFVCRTSCEAMNCIHSYVFNVPSAGCAQQYSPRFRLLVSSRNATERSRTVRNSASITALSPSISGSTGTGDFLRIHRDSTSAIGM